MKITDPQVIKNGEKNLIAAVQKNLDLETVKQILKDRMGETAFLSKGGQIVVHDNQIAFRLDFDLKLSGSLVFDRLGNYIPEPSESAPASDPDISEEPQFLTLSDDGMDDRNFPLEKDMDETFSTDPANENGLDMMPDDDDDLDLMSDDEEEGLDLMADDADLDDLTDADLADEDLTDADQTDLDDITDDDGLDPDDRLDDDIDDILKESREFWEQKKGS